MTEQQIEDLLSAFTHVLNHDQALDLSNADDAKKYVTGLHGGTDAVARLGRDILRRIGGGVFLFTGQPGSGKSTELQRLKRDLTVKACKVYYCDLQDWLNLNAPVTLASAVFDAVRDLRKPMDLPLWLGANRSHAQWHGEDLQRRHSGKSTVLCRE